MIGLSCCKLCGRMKFSWMHQYSYFHTVRKFGNQITQHKLFNNLSLFRNLRVNSTLYVQFQVIDRNFSVHTVDEVPIDPTAEENKTSVNILNESTDGIFFKAYSRAGFVLSNDVRVVGPVIVFPRSIYYWNISSAKDIGAKSLQVFSLLYPKLDILIIGKGELSAKINMDEIVKFSRQYKINFEVLSTESALSTFNFLNSEGRYVGAALLPPNTMPMFEEERLALEKHHEFSNVLDTSDTPDIKSFNQADHTLDIVSNSVDSGYIPSKERYNEAMKKQADNEDRILKARFSVQHEIDKDIESLKSNSEEKPVSKK